MKALRAFFGWIIILIGVVIFICALVSVVPALFLFAISKIGMFLLVLVGLFIAFLGSLLI